MNMNPLSPTPPPAAELLREWLRVNDFTHSQLGNALGKKGEHAVRGWLAGSFSPQLPTAIVIEQLTRGAVPVDAWIGALEIETQLTEALTSLDLVLDNRVSVAMETAARLGPEPTP